MTLYVLSIIVIIILIWICYKEAVKPKNHNQKWLIDRIGGGPRRWIFNNYAVLIPDQGECYATLPNYKKGFKNCELTDKGQSKLINLIQREYPLSLVKDCQIWLFDDSIKSLLWNAENLSKMLFGSSKKII